MRYTFGETLGSGLTFQFEIDLTDEQADIIRTFLKENGDCDYSYLESESPGLFEIINEAATEAAFKAINEERDEDDRLDYWDIDWGSISYDFYWPKELMK